MIRFVLAFCLAILAVNTADAQIRQRVCLNGQCGVPIAHEVRPPLLVEFQVPELQVYTPVNTSKPAPFNQRDLTMDYRPKQEGTPIAQQAFTATYSNCSGGQCYSQPQAFWGRVTRITLRR